MAEVDAFVFSALRQSGCLEADTPESAKELGCDALVAIVWRCLARLRDADDSVDLALPADANRAPVGVAARHRVGSQLANILKELGYAGDCGYNHFLYPSEKETRSILSWLVGKLPRSRLEEDDDGASGTLESGDEDASSATNAATAIAATMDDCAFSNTDLAHIFSGWQRQRTLYSLPNRSIRGLRGFQKLSLHTATLHLPWGCTEPPRASLFEAFPSDAVKPTSLLEALASARCASSVLLPEDAFDEDEGVEETAVHSQHGETAMKNAKRPVGGVGGGLLVSQAGEAESDSFAAVRPPSFPASALPDVPLSLDEASASPSTVIGAVEGVAGATETSSISLEMQKTSLEDGAQDGVQDGTQQEVGFERPKENEDDEQALEQLQKTVEDTQRRIAAMQKVLTREHAALDQTQQHVLEVQASGEELQRQLATQQQVVQMLPQAEANIAKLEAICATNAEKKEEIAREMQRTRAPLLEEEAQLVASKSSRKARCRLLIREIKEFRRDMQELAGAIHSKMEAVRVLDKVYERQVSKQAKQGEGEPMTRNMYTSRIMEIIKQVHKQKHDIAKVLEDINALQKQLNAASEKLKRTEAVTEEKLYSAASSRGADDAYVECYRKFAQVRELFEELIVAVGDVGKKENVARDLQNWISQLEARDSSSHLDAVLVDLQSVRLENSTLQRDLRARGA